jgi:hypothetical protein
MVMMKEKFSVAIIYQDCNSSRHGLQYGQIICSQLLGLSKARTDAGVRSSVLRIPQLD